MTNIEKLYDFIMDNGGQESFDRFISFLEAAESLIVAERGQCEE